MSFIEKVCEYSGEWEFPKYKMNKYKHNHIQIPPVYRKLFKNRHATLMFFKVDQTNSFHYRDRLGYCSIYTGPSDMEYEYINGELYHWVRDRYHPNREIAKRMRKVPFYEYALIVPAHPGRVNGIYMNHGYDKGAVIRKMKKMVGRTLEIKNVDISYSEWRDQLKSNNFIPLEIKNKDSEFLEYSGQPLSTNISST